MQGMVFLTQMQFLLKVEKFQLVPAKSRVCKILDPFIWKDLENDLNDLVVSFVESTNKIYNPDDQPGAYLFGFDAVLTRPIISGRNLLMEEEYGYFGREGDASITLYRRS